MYDPPEEERYQFKHERPRRVGGLKIYEAHVGMSSKDPQMGTYKDFTKMVRSPTQSMSVRCQTLIIHVRETGITT